MESGFERQRDEAKGRTPEGALDEQEASTVDEVLQVYQHAVNLPMSPSAIMGTGGRQARKAWRQGYVTCLEERWEVEEKGVAHVAEVSEHVDDFAVGGPWRRRGRAPAHDPRLD